MDSETFTSENNLERRIFTFIFNDEDMDVSDIGNAESWKNFILNENENYTPEELSTMAKEIFSSANDGNTFNFMRELNKIVRFLNWNHLPNYKKSLEYDRLQHIVFSWIVSSPEEIENDILLSINEICKRFTDLKDEYSITKVIPECLEQNYLQMIFEKIKEKFILETNIINEFEQLIS